MGVLVLDVLLELGVEVGLLPLVVLGVGSTVFLLLFLEVLLLSQASLHHFVPVLLQLIVGVH